MHINSPYFRLRRTYLPQINKKSHSVFAMTDVYCLSLSSYFGIVNFLSIIFTTYGLMQFELIQAYLRYAQFQQSRVVGEIAQCVKTQIQQQSNFCWALRKNTSYRFLKRGRDSFPQR